MIRAPWLLFALSLVTAVSLAGCGQPDEQEADESPASEESSVGEGEVPGAGPVLVVLAIAGAALLFARTSRPQR